MNPMERFRRNFKVASKLKIDPETWFSVNMATYCKHLASYYQVDGHAMVLALINGIASICRSTYVNRESHFLVPCNIFNLVVARSVYSKSTILDLAETVAEATVPYFPENLFDEPSNQITNELMVDDGRNSCATTTTNNLIGHLNLKRTHNKVVFNDGTAAGVLNNLKGCTRTMNLHEADGASTGDIIAAELARQAADMAADAFFERFFLWPMDGEPIPNHNCVASIDFSNYPSLEQFGILCGFFSNLYLDLEEEGKGILAEQSFNFRLAGSQEDVKDNISARLNKTALLTYRFAGLCALLEAAFDIGTEYIQEYITFGTGQADEAFFQRASKVAERKYGQIIRKERRLIIDNDVCKRAHDVTFQNLAQYMALMKIQEEDKNNWFIQSGRQMKSTMRVQVPEENTQVVKSIDNNAVFVRNQKNIDCALTRKQKNMLKKINSYKASILLHPSLIFIKSSLHANSSLKKTSSILETSFLKSLVSDRYLIAIPGGLVCRKIKATVYVKMIPLSDNESKEAFSARLASFHDERLTLNSYLTSCSSISLDSAGLIDPDVIEILQLERYQSLKIDFSSITQRAVDVTNRNDLSRTCSTSTQENVSIDSEINFLSNEDDSLINQLEHENNIQHHELNIFNFIDNFSETDDQSNYSASELVVLSEETIEQQPETIE
ncbi:unnamed protein product [Rotaria magnacalcarata]